MRVGRTLRVSVVVTALSVLTLTSNTSAANYPTVQVKFGQVVRYKVGIAVAVIKVTNPATSIDPTLLAPKPGFKFVTVHLLFRNQSSSIYRPFLPGNLYLRSSSGMTYGPDTSGIGVRDCRDAESSYSVVVLQHVLTRACVIFQMPKRTVLSAVIFAPPNSSPVLWRH